MDPGKPKVKFGEQGQRNGNDGKGKQDRRKTNGWQSEKSAKGRRSRQKDILPERPEERRDPWQKDRLVWKTVRKDRIDPGKWEAKDWREGHEELRGAVRVLFKGWH